MRRRATGDPASPGLLAQEGEATLQNNCWRYARELLFSSQNMSERVECSTNDTALAFPDIKDIYDQNRTAQDQFLPTPLMMTNKMADNQCGPDFLFSFFFVVLACP